MLNTDCFRQLYVVRFVHQPYRISFNTSRTAYPVISPHHHATIIGHLVLSKSILAAFACVSLSIGEVCLFTYVPKAGRTVEVLTHTKSTHLSFAV